MQSGGSFEYVQLSSSDADRKIAEINALILKYLSLASAYDDARDEGWQHGQGEGYAEGRTTGWEEGYNYAREAFWCESQHERRINEWTLGYEEGRRAGEEASDEQWHNGYKRGREEADEALRDQISGLENKVRRLKVIAKARHRAMVAGHALPEALDGEAVE